MELIDRVPRPAFDPTPFVTYNGPDDVNPTPDELVEELPAHMPLPEVVPKKEHFPRRGKGYLRAEIDSGTEFDDGSANDGASDDAFGDGLELPEIRINRLPESPIDQRSPELRAEAGARSENQAGLAGDGSDGPKRRRSRRRRGRSKSSGAETTTTGNETSAADRSSQPTARSSETSADGDGSAAPRKKRSRRRRGRRGNKDGGSGSSGESSGSE
ncbi:MAG: hypothetical protein R3C49_08770 [Planctomycetaceae bacterium]